MTYLDTSFIAPYYLHEASSQAITTVLQSLSAGSLIVSAWTRAEFASLLARRVHMQDITHPHALTIMNTFEQDLHASFQVITPTSPDFAAASILPLHHPALGLRSPDALHLAIAANRQLPIYTLDKTFIHAATTLGHTASNAGVTS